MPRRPGLRIIVLQAVGSCPSEQPTVIIAILACGFQCAGMTRAAGSRRPGLIRISPTSRAKS